MVEVIKLVRHGQSLANTGEVRVLEVGDHTIALTPRGEAQARDAGQRIGAAFIRPALVYTSPFRRARQTLDGVLQGAGLARDKVRIYEDPRLREVEHGYAEVEPQEALRETHGRFYYRFHGGESPADCFDRTAGFLDSMMRQVNRKQAKQALVITHGLTIRCFVMRFLHLTVEQFDSMANPGNCDVITLARRSGLEDPLFTSGIWGVDGLRTRE